MNRDLEKTVKSCSTCLRFEQAQLKDKIIPHRVPGKAKEVIGDYLVAINYNNFLCVEDYLSRYPILK